MGIGPGTACPGARGMGGVYAYRDLGLAYRKYHCEHAQ